MLRTLVVMEKDERDQSQHDDDERDQHKQVRPQSIRFCDDWNLEFQSVQV